MFDWFERGLDIALIITMSYFFLRGIFRGIVKEIIAILGIFVAFWVAGIYYPLVNEHLKTIFDLPGHRSVVSFDLIFVVIYFLIGIVSIFIDIIVKINISPIVSALLGGVAGIVKGVLFCAVIMAGTSAFIKPDEKFFTNSELWSYLRPLSDKAQELLPQSLKADMADNKRTPPLIGDRYRTGGQAESGEESPWAASSKKIDWPAVKNILATRPGEIMPEWKDKLRSMPGNKALGEEEIKKFISDHPALFPDSLPSPAGTSSLPSGNATTPAPAPVWAQPAE